MSTIATAMFLLLAFMLQNQRTAGCYQRFTPEYFAVDKLALLGHSYQWKTVSSPVICGRDCAMDPQCASFNYHTGDQICELNNATRGNFIQMQASTYMYFDSTKRYSSCQMWSRAGRHDDGIYTIFPAGLTADGIQVYCDMDTDGGGWIVFQRRQDGSVDFYRDWADYQSGFGNLSGEFWLGNDNLRTLTESGQWQLRVDIESWQGETAWANFREFSISGDKYTLRVGSYNADSTAGNSMIFYNGYDFTTKDQDNMPDEGNEFPKLRS